VFPHVQARRVLSIVAIRQAADSFLRVWRWLRNGRTHRPASLPLRPHVLLRRRLLRLPRLLDRHPRLPPRPIREAPAARPRHPPGSLVCRAGVRRCGGHEFDIRTRPFRWRVDRDEFVLGGAESAWVLLTTSMVHQRSLPRLLLHITAASKGTTVPMASCGMRATRQHAPCPNCSYYGRRTNRRALRLHIPIS